MDPTVLREHLSRLHEELGTVHQADPAANPLLGSLLQDIKRLLDAPPAAPSAQPFVAAGAAGGEPLSERLERVAVQFEADHPTLAASSRRLVDLLGKIGV